jgi:hypothetical protein
MYFVSFKCIVFLVLLGNRRHFSEIFKTVNLVIVIWQFILLMESINNNVLINSRSSSEHCMFGNYRIWTSRRKTYSFFYFKQFFFCLKHVLNLV